MYDKLSRSRLIFDFKNSVQNIWRLKKINALLAKLLVKERFLSTHSDTVKGDYLYKWRHTALGRLAEVYQSGLKFPVFKFLLYLAGRWDLGH